MSFNDRVVFEPEVRGRKPCIRGMRTMVYDIPEYFADGMTEDQIVDDFPSLQRKSMIAA